MNSTYRTAKTERCPSCGDMVSRDDRFLSKGRTVIATRNANKQVSPDRYYCEDCWAAGEYKQFMARVNYSVEMRRDLGREASFEEEFAAHLEISRRDWAPVLAKRAKGVK